MCPALPSESTVWPRPANSFILLFRQRMEGVCGLLYGSTFMAGKSFAFHTNAALCWAILRRMHYAACVYRRKRVAASPTFFFGIFAFGRQWMHFLFIPPFAHRSGTSPAIRAVFPQKYMRTTRHAAMLRFSLFPNMSQKTNFPLLRKSHGVTKHSAIHWTHLRIPSPRRMHWNGPRLFSVP